MKRKVYPDCYFEEDVRRTPFLLRTVNARDKRVVVPVKKAKRKSKGKQHCLRAESLAQIADALGNFSDDQITPTLDNKALLAGIARIFTNEFLRVRKILR